MNLKEIQDGAPEGATHYYKNKYGKIIYLAKSINESWVIFDEDTWLILVDSDIERAESESKPLYPTQEPKDPTNPSHYKQGKVECIDAIESATVGKKGIEAVLVGNIIKYLWRYEEKNGVEDVEKAKCYLDKLLEKLK